MVSESGGAGFLRSDMPADHPGYIFYTVEGALCVSDESYALHTRGTRIAQYTTATAAHTDVRIATVIACCR